MTETERLRQRLAAAGAEIPDALVELITAMAGPLLGAQDRLVELDLGTVEPFSPATRLVDDAR